MQDLTLLSFFLTKTTGDDHGFEKGAIMPFYNSYVTSVFMFLPAERDTRLVWCTNFAFVVYIVFLFQEREDLRQKGYDSFWKVHPDGQTENYSNSDKALSASIKPRFE